MYILRIEHAVMDFNGWKRAFDSDPLGRKRMGVQRYRILRPTNDPHLAMIDLELETATQAEALLAALRVMWGPIQGKLIMDPQARIVEVVESKEC
jgi:hypothetical protein